MKKGPLNRQLIYDYAMSFSGLPYRWGGDDPMTGFDCSGLVVEILQSCGVLPHKYDTNAQGLFHRFRGTKPSVLSADLGTLAFYGMGGKISHVAFCLDSMFMLEAGGGGSRTKDEEDAAQQNAFIRIRPIRYRKDLVALFNPDYSRGVI